MHFQQIFCLFLKCVIYFTTLESVCQDFFQTFSKSFLRFSWTRNPEINLCFTHFSLFSWLKNRLNTGFLNPYSLSFSPLSRDSFIILPHFARNVNTFFEFFSFFLRFFYFLSCHLFHHHSLLSDTFWMGVQWVRDWKAFSQWVKGIQSLTESDSFNESEE